MRVIRTLAIDLSVTHRSCSLPRARACTRPADSQPLARPCDSHSIGLDSESVTCVTDMSLAGRMRPSDACARLFRTLRSDLDRQGLLAPASASQSFISSLRVAIAAGCQDAGSVRGAQNDSPAALVCSSRHGAAGEAPSTAKLLAAGAALCGAATVGQAACDAPVRSLNTMRHGCHCFLNSSVLSFTMWASITFSGPGHSNTGTGDNLPCNTK